jgi:hypothetical protein
MTLDNYATQIGDRGLEFPNQVVKITTSVIQLVNQQRHGFKSTTACDPGGQITWSWQDKNADHQIDAGDSLTATLDNCSLLNDQYRGTMTIALTESSATRLALHVDMQLQQSKTLNKVLTWFPISGAMTLQNDSSAALDDVVITLNHQGLTLNDFLHLALNERLYDTTIHRSLDRISARYRVTLTEKIDSTLPGNGTISASTTTPLTGKLNGYPDGGKLQLKTSSNTVELTVLNQKGKPDFEVRYDLLSNGIINSTPIPGAWRGIIDGGLFADPQFVETNPFYKLPLPTNFNNEPMLDDVREVGGQSLMVNNSVTHNPPTFVLQFNQVLSSTLPQLKLHTTQSLTAIPQTITTTIQGAQLQIALTSALSPGAYVLDCDSLCQVSNINGTAYLPQIKFTVSP